MERENPGDTYADPDDDVMIVESTIPYIVENPTTPVVDYIELETNGSINLSQFTTLQTDLKPQCVLSESSGGNTLCLGQQSAIDPTQAPLNVGGVNEFLASTSKDHFSALGWITKEAVDAVTASNPSTHPAASGNDTASTLFRSHPTGTSPAGRNDAPAAYRVSSAYIHPAAGSSRLRAADRSNALTNNLPRPTRASHRYAIRRIFHGTSSAQTIGRTPPGTSSKFTTGRSFINP